MVDKSKWVSTKLWSLGIVHVQLGVWKVSVVWSSCMFTNSGLVYNEVNGRTVEVLGSVCNWGEPEWGPHLRDCTAHMCVYVCLLACWAIPGYLFKTPIGWYLYTAIYTYAPLPWQHPKFTLTRPIRLELWNTLWYCSACLLVVIYRKF